MVIIFLMQAVIIKVTEGILFIQMLTFLRIKRKKILKKRRSFLAMLFASGELRRYV